MKKVVVLLVISLCSLWLVCGAAEKEKGLAGWWKFDEGSGDTAKDASGNGNDGVINGAEWTAGKFGKALKFNGDGFVEISHSDALIPEKFTLEAWVNVSNIASDDRGPMILAKYGGNYKGYMLVLEGASGMPSMHIDSPENEIAITAQEAVKTGQWYHVAGTFDGAKGSLYVNGVLKDSKDCEITHDDGVSFFIGKASWFDGAYFFGSIDEVKIYNRVLAVDEIKTHATAK